MSRETDETPTSESSFCLFQEPWWLNLTTDGHWQEAVVANTQGVIARLPYRTLRRFGATIITQPRLTPYGGPWFRPSSAKAAHQFSERQKLTAELLSQLPRFDLFSQNLWPESGDWLPFHWAGYSQRTGYTNWHRDLSNTDGLWNGFLDSTRREIRKAQKRVELIVSDDIERLCYLHERAFTRQGLSPPRERAFVRTVVEGAMRQGHARLTFAVDEQQNTHAVNLLVFDARSAHYLLGGSDPSYRTSGAASLLMWDAIQFAAGRTKLFDFEGSMVEGVARFFRGFCPELIPISHVYRTSRRAALGAALHDAAAALFARPPLRL
ncbi:MAG: GNAT family N-acetyltransferase [Steroidobacteraceae bacterium]